MMPRSGCLCTSAQANCADGADAASCCCMQSQLSLNQMRPSTPPIMQHLACKYFIKVLAGDAAGMSCCIADRLCGMVWLANGQSHVKLLSVGARGSGMRCLFSAFCCGQVIC